MVRRRPRPPDRAAVLYEGIFGSRDRSSALGLISEGVGAVCANAERLLADVSLLAQAGHHASAGFLLTTANEEMAKAYILVDACRLDFLRHGTALKRLCRAFYDHVAKHAYTQIVRFPQFHDMAHVKEVWDIQVTRWWPSSGPESGEPDMPHDTYFTRELPLYVDFINCDGRWLLPHRNTARGMFEEDFGRSAFSDAGLALQRLLDTEDAGLFSAQCLCTLNDVFSPHYLTERTRTRQFLDLRRAVARRLEAERGIIEDRFRRSALDAWPLYHFVASAL
jgi:AbiV family abortive infection protein